MLHKISNDSSVDSLLFSCDSESEGGIWDNTNDDDVSFAPEESIQHVIPLYDLGIRAPVVGLPVDHGNEGVNQPPHNIPKSNPTPEGARC